mmetsp:Transcript_50668/g.82234  ORF Transcript_50668/g.82234 Transcript_50668/m.82234 type:complete len:200 (+) Transcript_50668:1318-1917(+)
MRRRCRRCCRRRTRCSRKRCSWRSRPRRRWRSASWSCVRKRRHCRLRMSTWPRALTAMRRIRVPSGTSSDGARMSYATPRRRTDSWCRLTQRQRTSTTTSKQRRQQSRLSSTTSSVRTCWMSQAAPSRFSSNRIQSSSSAFRSTSSSTVHSRLATLCPCLWRRSHISWRCYTPLRRKLIFTSRICSDPTPCSPLFARRT